ncbi:hypothetical protein [Deminuibacter soli]|uniref:Uncharacterized protein n=1 Tax=Deminuibacter soli TaxID=2291815 RepID=A0A3E1NPC9_9BACT|nr:hypothetical protein [Deminuibacter soli]RFM29770.1 hypothetical protein DXN05_01980 [Deminuibacter soli]
MEILDYLGSAQHMADFVNAHFEPYLLNKYSRLAKNSPVISLEANKVASVIDLTFLARPILELYAFIDEKTTAIHVITQFNKIFFKDLLAKMDHLIHPDFETLQSGDFDFIEFRSNSLKVYVFRTHRIANEVCITISNVERAHLISQEVLR